MIEAGKYDDLCSLVRKGTDAHAVALLVIGGNRGNGYAFQSTSWLTDRVNVPQILRDVANALEKDLEKIKEERKAQEAAKPSLSDRLTAKDIVARAEAKVPELSDSGELRPVDDPKPPDGSGPDTA